MIISVTINGVVNYIDTDMILYAYDNSGLTLVVASNSVAQNPNLELFVSASPQAATLPTYSDFKTATAAANFLECTHATYTNIYVNLKRIQRLQEVDSSNTTILFDKYNTVDTSTSLSTLNTAINDGLIPSGSGLTQQQIEGLI